MWFQNRRAKWRKHDHTKKGPGRPAHNTHPQTCSGQPLTPEEVERRERQRRERRVARLLEKQRRRLEARGVEVDPEALRREWERKNRDDEEEVDVVGSEEDEDEEEEDEEEEEGCKVVPSCDLPRARQRSSFSIDSLLGADATTTTRTTSSCD